MAKNNRAATARRNSGAVRNSRNVYVDGSAARRLQEVPDRVYYPKQASAPEKNTSKSKNKSAQPRTPRQPSSQAIKNRKKATSMSSGFVVFLAVISVAILFSCIYYLRLKSEITAQMKHVAYLESELADLKEDNDAYYSQVTSNIDLDAIKKIAIGRLGMKYPSKNQVRTYKTQGGSYLRQYQDVPELK